MNRHQYAQLTPDTGLAVFQAGPSVPEDEEMTSEKLNGPINSGSTLLGSSPNNGRRGTGRNQLRPSMEARWRKLDISALQALTSLFYLPGRKIEATRLFLLLRLLRLANLRTFPQMRHRLLKQAINAGRDELINSWTFDKRLESVNTRRGVVFSSQKTTSSTRRSRR